MTGIPRHEAAAVAADGPVDLLGLGSCALIVASLWVALGPVGAAIGIVATLVWALLGAPYAIAVGHVLLVPVVAWPIALETLALIEVGFVALVLLPLVRSVHPARVLLATLAGVGLIVAATAVAYATQPLWVTVVVVLLAIALVAYGQHRVTLVRLDKVEVAA